MISPPGALPFAGFVAAKPYPVTGFNARRWRDVSTGWIFLLQLVLTQTTVRIYPMFCPPPQDDPNNDPFPHVVLWRDTYYLDDGHHRVVRAALSGTTGLYARIYHCEAP